MIACFCEKEKVFFYCGAIIIIIGLHGENSLLTFLNMGEKGKKEEQNKRMNLIEET